MRNFLQKKKACVQTDQDYRVYSVCYRLLGRIVAFDGKMFSKLALEQPGLLTGIAAGLRSTEPALRVACFETCRGFTNCLEGTVWLLENEKIKTLMSSILLDDSTYVVAESFKFFQSLVESKDKTGFISPAHQEALSTLSGLLDPSATIKELLQPDVDPGVLMPVLEFCRVMANSRTTASLNYLEDSGILHTLLLLLDDSNRIVRTRMIEILSELFKWAPDPLGLLLPKPTEPASAARDHIRHAYDFVILLVIDRIQNPDTANTIVSGLSLLPCVIDLLKRLENKSVKDALVIQGTFTRVLEVCIKGHTLKDIGTYTKTVTMLNTSRSLSYKKSLMQTALRGLNYLVSEFPDTDIAEPSLNSVLLILLDRKWAVDQSILKMTLDLLLSLLHALTLTSLTSSNISTIVYKTMDKLIQILNEDDANCRCVSRILGTFDAILENPKLSEIAMGTIISASFVNALKLKFMDPEWDVRDTAVEFVGRLFELQDSSKSTFAIQHNLPMLIFDRIHDNEPYVRASALTSMQFLLRNRKGWAFIQEHPKTRDIARKLPRLLHDDEAFVRRAALDVLSCLVDNRSCQGIQVGLNNDIKDSLNPAIVSRMMDDPDSEVRVRACRFLESLWNLHLHDSEQQKRNKTDDDFMGVDTESYFYVLEGNRLLLDAVRFFFLFLVYLFIGIPFVFYYWSTTINLYVLL
ncbi:armadillo-type protein [Phycomyces blakesleeanus]